MTLDVYYFLLLLDIYYLEHPFNFFSKGTKEKLPSSVPPNYTLGWKIYISIYINEWPLKGKDSPWPMLRKR